MKYLFPYLFLIFFWLLDVHPAKAQNLPEVLQRVLKTDTLYYKLSCKLKIEIDVQGLQMPEKEIELILEKGKKPKIKSKGLIILPKRGIIGQYRDFLAIHCQTIRLTNNGDTTIYKIVSLDKKTDWVTVDVEVTETDARVHSLLISTRKNGEFKVNHFYGAKQQIFPELTVIEFEAMPLKLPLKFLGQSNKTKQQFNKDGPVNGKVNLFYSDVEILNTKIND